MSTFAVNGWCPGAHRPMLSGDGLIVRVRPHLGRLSATQAEALADAAEAFGNSLIDLSARANLQLRGVSEATHAPLLAELAELDLLDADVSAELRRNVVVAPFWSAGEETSVIATRLEQALVQSDLALPAKFGFAVDCGRERVLASASADIRIERSLTGGLIVRADGARLGRAVTIDEAVPAAMALAEWFKASGGVRGGRGRMAAHIASGAGPPPGLVGDCEPASSQRAPEPGPIADGVMVTLPFGQLQAETLRTLAASARELRLTPWRMLFVPGLRALPPSPGLILEPGDPLLRVVACTGAPGCSQALADTRQLARSLAPHVPHGSLLHVSGCAKGCAHPGPASVTLIATRSGFDIAYDAAASGTPTIRGRSTDILAADPKAYLRAS